MASHVSDNEHEARVKRVLRLLEEPLTRNQLTRRTQWLRHCERQEILESLIEAELVDVREETTFGRPVIKFYRTAQTA